MPTGVQIDVVMHLGQKAALLDEGPAVEQNDLLPGVSLGKMPQRQRIGVGHVVGADVNLVHPVSVVGALAALVYDPILEHALLSVVQIAP